MPFDSMGWAGYFPLTSKHAAILSVPTQALIDLGGLIPSGDSWWSNVASDGRDIRVVDASGTELDIRLIGFNKTSKVGWIQAAVGSSLSTSTDQTWKIYAGNTSATWPSYDVFSASGSPVAAFDFTQDPSGSAPQLTDATGNGHDGTSYGSMASGDRVSGPVASAWKFSGGKCAALPTVNFSTTDKITVGCWIYFDSLPATSDAFMLWEGSPNYNLYKPNVNAYLNDNGTIDAGISHTGGYAQRRSAALSTGQWYRLEVVYDTTLSSSEVTIYVDGASSGSMVPGYDYNGSGNFSDSAFYIGARNTSSFPLSGRLSNFSLTYAASSANLASTHYANESAADGIWTAGEWVPSVPPEDITLTVPIIAPSVTVTAPSIRRHLGCPIIAPAVTVTAPTVIPGSRSLTVPTIAPTVSVTAPTITRGARVLTVPIITCTPVVTAPGISSSIAVVDIITLPVSVTPPVVVPGPVTLTVPIIAPSVTMTAPAVKAETRLTPGTIAPATAVTPPAVVPGPITLTVPIIAPALTVTDARLVQRRTPGTIVCTPTVTPPAVIAGSVSRTVPIIAPDVVVTAPSVVPGAISIAAPTIAPAVSVSAPAVRKGAVRITVPMIAPTISVTAPAVRASTKLQPAPIVCRPTVTAPAVVAGPITIQPGTITAAATVTGPQLRAHTTLTPGTIAPTVTVTAPAVHRRMSVPIIAPSVTVTAPDVVRGARILTPGTIAPAVTVTAPAVVATKRLTVETIAPTVTVTAPAVKASTRIVVPAIVCRPTVTAPAIIPGPITLSTPIITPQTSVSAALIKASKTLAAGIAVAGTITVIPPDVRATTRLRPEPIIIAPTVTAPGIIPGPVTVPAGLIVATPVVTPPRITGRLTIPVLDTITLPITVTAPGIRSSSRACRIWTVELRSVRKSVQRNTTWTVEARSFTWTIKRGKTMATEILRKQPGESLVFAFDFSDVLSQIGSVLASVDEITATPAGLTLTEEQLNSAGMKMLFRIAGGTRGTMYKLTAKATTAAGNQFESGGKIYLPG